MSSPEENAALLNQDNTQRTPDSAKFYSPGSCEPMDDDFEENGATPKRQEQPEETKDGKTTRKNKKRKFNSSPLVGNVTLEDEILNDILQALDIIKKHTASCVTEALIDARETIYRNIVLLTSKSKQVEIENVTLRMELSLRDSVQISIPTSIPTDNTEQKQPKHQQQQQQQPQQRDIPAETASYAQATARSYGEFPKRNPTPKNETYDKWKPPEITTKKTNELYLTSKNDASQMEDKWENLRKTIDPKAIHGGVKNIVRINKNKMLIQTENQMQKEKLLDIFSKDEDIEVKENNTNDPIIQISGVYGEINEMELKERLLQENEDLAETFPGDKIQTGLKLLAKKKCRNDKKSNLILQVKPDIASFLLQKEKINLDLVKHYITEVIDVTICFLCCGYGHVQKYCDEKTETCHKCGQKHDSRTCQEDLNCINCQKLRISARAHSARDYKCPCRIKKIEDKRKNTNYFESK